MHNSDITKKGGTTTVAPLAEKAQSKSPPLLDNRPGTIQRQGDFLQDNRQQTIQQKANNTGLPTQLKNGVESLSGMGMDDVKVHYNSAKPAQLQALAYAQGTDIHIGPGQEKHLPHEAWHVVQQKQGRVQPTIQMKQGVAVNDDKGLEKEADEMGRSAMQLRAAGNMAGTARAVHSGNTGIVQRVGKVGEQPEAFGPQLLSRITNIWSEAGLQDDDILKTRLAGEIATMGGAQPPATTNQVGDLIKAAIHQSMASFGGGLEHYYLTIMSNMAILAHTNPVALPLDTCMSVFRRKVNNRANELIHDQIENSENNDLKEAAKGLVFDYDDTGAGRFTKLAQNFHQQSRINVAAPFNLSPSQKGKLTRALMKMPMVRDMLSGETHHLDHKKTSEKSAQNHKFIKWLAPEIVPAEDSELNGKVVASINQAMIRIVNMVAPAVLAMLPVPKIVVHRNTGLLDAIKNQRLADIAGYRASSSRETIHIDISETQSVPVIVHEIGHQLEYFLHTSHWMNIQKLIRGRHAQVGGAGNLKSIYPYMPSSSVRSEPAYQSPEVPVTGTYSMKHYMGGATEIFSMTMEYFSTPENALKLIQNDPLQAAIILDAIQPNQLAENLPDELYHLLPNRFTEMQ
jgi:hypothetical protein